MGGWNAADILVLLGCLPKGGKLGGHVVYRSWGLVHFATRHTTYVLSIDAVLTLANTAIAGLERLRSDRLLLAETSRSAAKLLNGCC